MASLSLPAQLVRTARYTRGAPPSSLFPVTVWRERFLGHPDEYPERYDACSLLGEAHRLTRPLLLIHGLADTNVRPVHTLRLSEALLAGPSARGAAPARHGAPAVRHRPDRGPAGPSGPVPAGALGGHNYGSVPSCPARIGKTLDCPRRG
ncbi:alpha/beta hydrolase family protein [Streptomyces sp. NPDC058755]|uniref:alpha/beta hydrolase family protein n=1 Tax=Streptomyces sp. NPDC058755 TaxID=3346624 RepID=UPI0036B35E43